MDSKQVIALFAAYIGAPCVADQGTVSEVRSTILSVHTNGNIQLARSYKNQQYWEYDRVKLILRTLSAITDHELSQLFEIGAEGLYEVKEGCMPAFKEGYLGKRQWTVKQLNYLRLIKIGVDTSFFDLGYIIFQP